MGIILYYLENESPIAESFGQSEILSVLSRAEQLRKLGHRHVSISSEFDEQVGGAGVTSVTDGKLPNGNDYDWKKRR